MKSGHYDNTVFHRVINNFHDQGGGFGAGHEAEAHSRTDQERSQQRPDQQGRRHRHGSYRGPHSASAQFFINVADNDFLNHTAPTTQGWGYAVFGEVVEGMDVVNKIKERGHHHAQRPPGRAGRAT